MHNHPVVARTTTCAIAANNGFLVDFIIDTSSLFEVRLREREIYMLHLFQPQGLIRCLTPSGAGVLQTSQKVTISRFNLQFQELLGCKHQAGHKQGILYSSDEPNLGNVDFSLKQDRCYSYVHADHVHILQITTDHIKNIFFKRHPVSDVSIEIRQLAGSWKPLYSVFRMSPRHLRLWQSLPVDSLFALMRLQSTILPFFMLYQGSQY